MSRKEQIATLTAEGKTTKQIAEQLGISTHTVRFHREPSKQKLPTRPVVARPGDTLIFRGSSLLSTEATERVEKSLAGKFPNNRVVVIDRSLEIVGTINQERDDHLAAMVAGMEIP